MSSADKPPTGLGRKFASEDPQTGMRYMWTDQEISLIQYNGGEPRVIERFRVGPGYYTLEPVALVDPFVKPRARL